MKKTLFLMLLTVASMSTFAQIRVNNNGTVEVGGNTDNSVTKFSIGNISASGSGNVGIAIKLAPNNSNSSNIGMTSNSYFSTPATGYSATIGVIGSAGNGTQGMNLGLIGCLSGNRDGVGMLGSLYGTMFFSGQYAGYFWGDTYVNGTLTATQVNTPSDIRLKENIAKIDEDGNSTLADLMALNVIKYNYKEKKLDNKYYEENSKLFGDAFDKDKAEEFNKKEAQKLHFGISAQELQELFPNLVEEGQDGYLSVNYVEMVPILIRSIQELKQEIDALKANTKETIKKQGAVTAVENVVTGGSILYQNIPNPFTGKTTIRFHLVDDIRGADICIFDMQGKLLRTIPVSSGMDSVLIDSDDLGKGMFLYSLIVNGQEIDTKKMVISK